jgi:hypothetical protein
MFKRSAIVIGSVLALSAGTAFAHHSFAMFDNAKEQTLEGTIKDFQWTNPHIWIQVNVKGADGKLTEWSIEGGSPNGLKRSGWSKKSMNAGDKVVMKIHPLKDGTSGGSFMSATVNGQELGRRGGE